MCYNICPTGALKAMEMRG
ncbi:MAG: hypothetical protein Q9M89_05125 [Persephonella sp.]|nr:hypothetical protein [Persephonella sp.]